MALTEGFPLDMGEIVAELCADPHGRALWERAQYKVAFERSSARIRDLEEQQNAAAGAKPAGAAS